MMDAKLQKEQFSRAYVHAVASVAGYSLYKPDVDDDSIDTGFAQRGGAANDCYRSPRLEAQLKCTSLDVIGDDVITFDLKLKNYNDLRLENFLVPRVLIVVVVPEDVEDWLTQTEEQLVLRRCAWWVSLRSQPPTDNAKTVRVSLPRTQMFGPKALQEIMQLVAAGEKL